MARSRSGRRCATCGQPLRPTTATQAERFYRGLLRVFSADPVAHGVVVDAFAALQRPEAEGGGGCPNALDAFLNMCRSVVAEFGGAG